MREEKQRQIVETLRKDISDGRYGSGRPFPSERALARQAFRFLLDRMENAFLAPRECLLDAPLVVRRSTKGVFL